MKQIIQFHDNNPIWTGNGKWNPESDSLHTLIDSARYYGLFPKDYHIVELDDLRQRLIFDTTKKEDKLDAVLWAKNGYVSKRCPRSNH